MAMTPLAISPPSSTPEPDMSSIPQDAATVPHSSTPEVLTGNTQTNIFVTCTYIRIQYFSIYIYSIKKTLLYDVTYNLANEAS